VTCQLPTPEDRLLFVLMYLKAAPLQLVHATAFGLTQPKANLWLHVLLSALRNALSSSGDCPARSVEALRERLAALTTAASAEPATYESDLPPTPFFTTALSAPSHARPTRLNRKTTIAARRNAI